MPERQLCRTGPRRSAITPAWLRRASLYKPGQPIAGRSPASGWMLLRLQRGTGSSFRALGRRRLHRTGPSAASCPHSPMGPPPPCRPRGSGFPPSNGPDRRRID
eukprot:scaffold3415_cov368-Prasinococcus_capsulatus_cf.AAC.1